VNGHIESNWSKTTGQWSPLRFVADPFMRIHGMSPALNYGQQAYEGLKAFRMPGDKGISIFRPDRNAKRLQHSAEVVSIPPVPEELFLEGVRAAVALNAEFVPPHETGAALYVRPQVYGSSAQLGLSPPDEYTFCVFVVPTGVYHGVHPTKALILDEFDRAAPNGTGNAKVGGNYAPVLRWSDAARNQGYGITLHLDSARHEEIDEFSTSGFIGALTEGNDVTLVVPDSQCIINSVTSDSIQDIARSFGWKVKHRPIKYSELAAFSEVMAAGTAAALVPIRSITRRGAGSHRASLPADAARVSVNTAEKEETVTYIAAEVEDAGPICTKLLTQLKAIQLGKVEDTFGWRCEVTGKDTKIASAQEGGQSTPTVDQMD
jgi:branched-chain amino acid aminotransferase